MKLVHQVHLYFNKGNSDKVYEIDLCQVGQDEYLVNYRYGRRGANLVEGTKTVFPVSYEAAQKAFEKLKASKTKKGYKEAGLEETENEEVKENIQDENTVLEELDERATKILSYLKAASEGKFKEKNWKLSRIIWKAGELRLKEVTPYLEAIQPKYEMEAYCIIWALARCGSTASISHIKRLSYAFPDELLKKLSDAASMMCADASGKEAILKEVQSRLKGSLSDFIDNNDYHTFNEHLHSILFESNSTAHTYLESLYLLAQNNHEIYKILVDVISKTDLKPNFFKHFRHIFKMAEMFDDAKIYALIAKKIESSKPYFNMPVWYDKIYVDGNYIPVNKELKKKNSRLAFSNKTKEYFLKRVYRWINKLAYTDDLQYTKMASQILLSYTDEDNKGAFQDYVYDWSDANYQVLTVQYPPFYQYKTFGFILFQNSDRLVYRPNSKGWSYLPSQDSNTSAPEKREEAVPELWDKDCQSLARILIHNQCEPVNEFAVKAFRANPDKEKSYTTEFIISLLEKKYPSTNSLGLELANALFDPDNPQFELVLALLQCNKSEARTIGIQWLETHKEKLLTDRVFCASLVFNKFEDIHKKIRDIYSVYQWDSKLRSKIINSVLKQFTKPKPDYINEEAYNRILDTIFYLFQKDLFKTPIEKLIPLISHQIENVGLLGVKILLNHETKVDEFPTEIFNILITSDSNEIRKGGIVLFGGLSENILLNQQEIVANFCISAHSEIRKEATGIVKKLNTANAAFGEKLIELFLPVFFKKEKYEGLHKDLKNTFIDALANQLHHVSSKDLWKLLRSQHLPSNELGFYILKTHVDSSSISIREFIELSNNELIVARSFVRDYFNNNVSRIQYELEEAVKILDSKWEDSRTFGFRFFDQHINEQWTSKILISLCDNNNEEIQQYGKKLVTKFFQSEDGLEYMIKLSQHPNIKMQLFVSNYLEKYASGSLGNIKELEYYFTTVLSQINKGRVSKERVYRFITKESDKDVAIAEWFIPLLTRLSLTVSVIDKAHCIELLYKIQSKYAHLETILTINEIPTK